MAEANGEQGSINLDDTKDIDTDLSGEEDPAVLKEHAEKTKTFAKQAVARAKKAEKELKDLKEKVTPPEPAKPPTGSSDTKPVITAETVDERVLQAQKVPQDEINQLKKIAALNGTSIIEAQSDELFLSWKAQKEAKAKEEKARLGASHGSGSGEKKKDLNTPGISDAEHKELWKKQNG